LGGSEINIFGTGFPLYQNKNFTLKVGNQEITKINYISNQQISFITPE